VVYNGTNFQLINPQAAITQTATAGALTLGGNLNLGGGGAYGANYNSSGGLSSVTFGNYATTSSSSNLGTSTLTASLNSGTGQGGNVVIKPGGNTGGGAQGFANVQQSFTIAAATTVGHVMAMTTTGDEVQAAALGSTNNVGVAATTGGTNAQLYVASVGKILTVFDGTPVVGDLACAPPASTGTSGLAHDNGSTACPAGQKLGVVTGQVSGTGSGATATVLLQLGS
jgi:hypothetical protein